LGAGHDSQEFDSVAMLRLLPPSRIVAMIQHKTETVTRGDVWRFSSTLYDRDGNAMVLTADTIIEWALVDADRIPVIKVSRDDGTITVSDANAGTIAITVPAGKTDVKPGDYTDALRITIAGEPQTMWSGQIVVEDSPFLSVAEQPAESAAQVQDEIAALKEAIASGVRRVMTQTGTNRKEVEYPTFDEMRKRLDWLEGKSDVTPRGPRVILAGL
jgi:hypothetical protein